MTAVLRSSLPGCAAQRELWRSLEDSGRKGTTPRSGVSDLCQGGLGCNIADFGHAPLVRIAIEEDYAKRLAKLAKLPLGRDEIG